MYEDVIKNETLLPEDFDGRFYFTNEWKDREFVGKWNSKEYRFPPESTSPMIMPEHSPLEIQHIRKKFAKDWAEQNYFLSKEYEAKRQVEGTKRLGTIQPNLNSMQQASAYTLEDLAPDIQKCLTPLTMKKASVFTSPNQNIEDKLSRNDEGALNTSPINRNASLKSQALKGEGLPTA